MYLLTVSSQRKTEPDRQRQQSHRRCNMLTSHMQSSWWKFYSKQHSTEFTQHLKHSLMALAKHSFFGVLFQCWCGRENQSGWIPCLCSVWCLHIFLAAGWLSIPYLQPQLDKQRDLSLSSPTCRCHGQGRQATYLPTSHHMRIIMLPKMMIADIILRVGVPVRGASWD
jgi:hypothetical protein